jgi:FAD synthase
MWHHGERAGAKTWDSARLSCRSSAAAGAVVSEGNSWRTRLHGTSPTVALGKFDALHRGHQKLIVTAANLITSSTPYLISFDGMAEVLGWEPRLPLVAPCDRKRVLGSWKKACLGTVPQEHGIPFSQVRNLSPEEFVALLAEDLGVTGVVVGSNYRFGYRAKGTAEMLKVIGGAYGMKVEVVNLVEREGRGGEMGGHAGLGETVSSSAVRNGLMTGDMKGVKECMGRPYRLVGSLEAGNGSLGSEPRRIERGAFLNQYPAAGVYDVMTGFASDEMLCDEDVELRPGRLVIDEHGGATIETLRDAGSGAAGRRQLCIVEFDR